MLNFRKTLNLKAWFLCSFILQYAGEYLPPFYFAVWGRVLMSHNIYLKFKHNCARANSRRSKTAKLEGWKLHLAKITCIKYSSWDVLQKVIDDLYYHLIETVKLLHIVFHKLKFNFQI